MNDPSASVAPPVRAALYCARLASAAVRRAVACSSADRASSRRLAGAAPAARQPLGALAIASRQGERGLGFGASSLKLRKVGRRRGWRQQPREFLSARHAGAKRDLHDACQPTVDGSDDIGSAARSRFEARGNTNGFTDRLLLHERRPEVEAPLLLLEETDAWRILGSCWRGGTGGLSIEVHLDVAYTMFVVQSCGLEDDHELALARVRRFHVDAEDAWPRRRVNAEHFGCAAPPSSRTSTLPSVSALKPSRRVR